MSNVRIIARLDIKGPNVIKGIHLEGLRVVGDPQELARRYYEEGADELIYMDTVASLYGRNNIHDIVRNAARDIFVPMTVGGGIRSAEDVRDVLRAGADKVAINTAAIARPELIGEVARRFGSQCMVLSVEAKKTPAGGWEAYTDNGREASGRDVVEWCREAVERGAGEILLTSVDRDGTQKGFDLDLVEAVARHVPIPVIASGGMGKLSHLSEAVDHGADAVAVAHVLHFGKLSLADIRDSARAHGLGIREIEAEAA